MVEVVFLAVVEVKVAVQVALAFLVVAVALGLTLLEVMAQTVAQVVLV
jgi:hypothetical protein